MPSSAIGSLESPESLGRLADISDDDYETSRELLETNNSKSLLEALYQDHPSITADSIATVALNQPRLALAVASMLEPLLEHEMFVRLCQAHALAQLTADPQAIAIALHAAVALTDPPTKRFPAIKVAAPIKALFASKPLAVIPRLVAFLPGVRDGTLRGEVLKTLDQLILNQFAVPDGDPGEGRALTLALLGDLLKDDTVDQSLVEQVAEIVRARTCAGILGEGFDSVIKELAKASGVAVERIGWGIWGELLTSPNEAERGRVDPEAAEWAIRNLSEKKPPSLPWTWRAYDHIARYLRQPKYREHRIEAVRRIGEYGPTSIRDPLPDDVKALQELLEALVQGRRRSGATGCGGSGACSESRARRGSRSGDASHRLCHCLGTLGRSAGPTDRPFCRTV